MSKLEKLKAKQAKELETLQLEESITNALGMELKMFASTGYRNDTTIFIDLEETKISEITPILEKIVSVFPPTAKTHEIDYKKGVTHVSPFLLDTQSNIRSRGKVILNYYNEYHFRITLPIKFYSDDIVGYYRRSVTDSEYHYFGGTSMAEIRKMSVEKRKFDLFETLEYYGGSASCVITNKEDLEEYNFVALNGHIMQHGEFWKEQKENL